MMLACMRKLSPGVPRVQGLCDYGQRAWDAIESASFHDAPYFGTAAFQRRCWMANLTLKALIWFVPVKTLIGYVPMKALLWFAPESKPYNSNGKPKLESTDLVCSRMQILPSKPLQIAVG